MHKPELEPLAIAPPQEADRRICQSLMLRGIGLRACLTAALLGPGIISAMASAQPGDRPLLANEVFSIPNSDGEIGPHQDKIIDKGSLGLRAVSDSKSNYAEFANTPPSEGGVKRKGKLYVHCNYNLYYPRNIELKPIPAVVEGRLAITGCKNVRGKAVRMTANTGLWRIPLDDLGNFDMKNKQLESLGDIRAARLFKPGEGDKVTWFCMRYGSEDTFPEYWATSAEFSALSVVPENGDETLVQSSSALFMTRPKKVLCN